MMYFAHGGSLVAVSDLPYLSHSAMLLRYLLYTLHQWQVLHGQSPGSQQSRCSMRVGQTTEGTSQRQWKIHPRDQNWREGGQYTPIHCCYSPIHRGFCCHTAEQTQRLWGQTATIMFMSNEYKSHFERAKQKRYWEGTKSQLWLGSPAGTDTEEDTGLILEQGLFKINRRLNIQSTGELSLLWNLGLSSS